MEQTLIFAQTPDLDYMTSQIASYLNEDAFLVVRHHRHLFMGIAVEGLTIEGPTYNKTDGVKALIDSHTATYSQTPNTVTVDKNEVTLKTHVDANDYFTLTPRKTLKKG
jgi:hypothetical protein